MESSHWKLFVSERPRYAATALCLPIQQQATFYMSLFRFSSLVPFFTSQQRLAFRLHRVRFFICILRNCWNHALMKSAVMLLFKELVGTAITSILQWPLFPEGAVRSGTRSGSIETQFNPQALRSMSNWMHILHTYALHLQVTFSPPRGDCKHCHLR